MDRRRFIGTVSGALLPASLVAHAQQPVKVARIGVLSVVWTRQTNPILSGLLTGLRDLGYVEGQTIVIEYRSADGQVERMRRLAAELVGLKVDVIVAVATPSIQAAKEATATIPIVMAFSGGDPVQSGFVTTLSRPGGNVTGLTLLASLSTKRMELVKDALPGLHVAAVLANPGNASNPQQLQGIQTAAQSLRLRIQVLQVRVPSELRTAFLETSEEAGALVVLADPMLFAELQQILDLAATRRLPVFSDWKEMAEAGGLIAYGPNLNLLARRAATYVDKILKGAKPGDLPIEQPTKFELVINLKTAKTLGITIPQSVLLRADEVIQ